MLLSLFLCALPDARSLEIGIDHRSARASIFLFFKIIEMLTAILAELKLSFLALA